MFEPLKEQDQRDWESYIQNFFSQPEETIIPLKEPQSLKRRLDLHGMTVSEAHGKVLNFVAEHFESQSENMVVITGKSGQISYEFQEWCKQLRCIRRVEPIIDSRGGIGSYRIWLKKSK